jgi:hypothetical protein
MPLLTEPRAPSWLPTLQLEISEDHCPPDWAQYLRFKAG